ncbi:DUF3265 domain-containing protein, partial [Vibrio anguillarum]|nr:DUF3265 domain-containing protein [Vibrio anguillarum]MBF4436967.1 DUF3265 domain-containing protein [Vibrio anguillarum]
MVFKYTKSNHCVTLARKLTSASRGTA